MVVREPKLFLFFFSIGVESDAPVDQSIFSAFVSLKCLPTDLLFSVDKSIAIPVMVVINFPIPSVYLDQLFPVVRALRAFVMLDEFEIVGKSSSHHEFISSILVESEVAPFS